MKQILQGITLGAQHRYTGGTVRLLVVIIRAAIPTIPMMLVLIVIFDLRIVMILFVVIIVRFARVPVVRIEQDQQTPFSTDVQADIDIE